MKQIISVLIILTFVCTTVYAANLKLGDVAPDFTLKDTSGKEVNLKDYKGKVLILNFFGDWCGWCHKEASDLVKVYASYKDKGVEFLSVDYRDTEKQVSQFVEKYKITWKVLLDSKAEIVKLYNITGFPTNLIIDKESKIRFKSYAITEKDLKSELDKVLK